MDCLCVCLCRLLTMPSGERIQFGPNVNFLFESHDLSCASPATISRMGMIFLRFIKTHPSTHGSHPSTHTHTHTHTHTLTHSHTHTLTVMKTQTSKLSFQPGSKLNQNPPRSLNWKAGLMTISIKH